MKTKSRFVRHLSAIIPAWLLLAAALPVRAADETSATNGDNYVTVYGARIHYLEAGVGPTVVLVHGLADSANTWRLSMTALSKKYHVVAPDLIGHGRSDKPLLDYRAETFTDFLTGFLDALHIERATFVGQSLGGWAITLGALQQPARFERLVLVDSAGFADQKLPSCLNPATLAQSQELLQYVFATARFTNNPALPIAILKARVTNGDGYTIARFLESAKRNEDALDGRLAGLKIPTLVVWGEQDRLLPLATGRRFAREIAGARLQIIPNGGHDVQLENAQLFNQALLAFLAEPLPASNK